jgi:hypothetical protein
VLVEEAAYADLRAVKSWILGDERSTRAASEEVLRTAQSDGLRATARGILATLDGDEQVLREALTVWLNFHTKKFARVQHWQRFWLPVTLVALCCIARTAGIEIGDSHELPTRFLAAGTLR